METMTAEASSGLAGSNLGSLGQTRSAWRRDHLLQTPDTFVRTPLPGLKGGVAIVHATPRMGAAFSMMTVELGAGGELSEAPGQRFVYVLAGSVAFSSSAEPEPETQHTLLAGDYGYSPCGQKHRVSAVTAAKIVVIEKPFVPLPIGQAELLVVNGESDRPWFLTGREAEMAATALQGDDALQVRTLLPDSLVFDFACNTMEYAPGGALGQVEVHSMEHGLLMLEGGGIYRLGDAWYPVQAGDFIWMGPYCPQWFGAIGKQPAKYLIYKDWNRHAL